MSVAVICTGTELLKGGCCNTNLFHAGSLLAENAAPPIMEISVGDHPQELIFALSCALKCADTIIITGGLGPTADDITLETVAGFFGLAAMEVPALKEKVEKRWYARHTGKCPKNQYKQARIIENGKYFDNSVGMAPGIGFEIIYGGKEHRIYLFPGPPQEFEATFAMALDEIIAHDADKKFTTGFFVVGTGETLVMKTAESMLADIPVEIACTAVSGGTKLFLSAADRELLDKTAAKVHDAFGRKALDVGCFTLSKALLDKLRAEKMTFGCAESCTGGILSDILVSVPGASDVFKGGIVSYANDVKSKLLGVSGEILQKYGAVSHQCAQAMASGAAAALECDCAVSTTGIAGPGGGSEGKPVGLVYVAAFFRGISEVRELRLYGNRRTIRERAAAAALQLLWELLVSSEDTAC